MPTETDAVLIELRRIFKLILTLGVGDKSQKDQILMLDSMGLSFQEIADMLGMKADAVRMAVSRSKK